MQLERFHAEAFRNLSEVLLQPAPGMNVIYGENAQGKTNLLEAVYVLSTLRSFRTRQVGEALKFGEHAAFLQGAIQHDAAKHVLAVSLQENQKVLTLDRKRVDALTYLGVFNVFLFSYPLLEVVRGGPEGRRRFLDRSVATSKPAYLALLVQYHRVVKQKNALLARLQRGETSRREGTEQVRSFNEQLLQYGMQIAQERVRYLSRMQVLLQEKQQLFFEVELRLGAELKSTFFADAVEVRGNLDRMLEKEIARGFTLLGVHLDEVVLTIDGKELRRFGSSGQHRAFLLLMLLAQLHIYEEMRNDRPLLLLDDLDSELDERRIEAFLQEVKDRYQTLISSSRRELFRTAGDVKFFEIQSGRVLVR